MKVTKEEMERYLILFGEALPLEEWQTGEKIIRGYIHQLEEEVSRLKGQAHLEGWEHI